MSKLVTSAATFGETENGALTHVTTGSQVLDLFAQGGALRASNEARITGMVGKAWGDSPENTLAVLLYLRDIRGGQGEKKVFREACKYLIKEGKIKNLDALFDAIVEVGSWKDIFNFFPIHQWADYAKRYHENHVKAEKDSGKDIPDLFYKWLPSIGGSRNKDAEKLALVMGMSPKQYRKMLTSERAKIKLVETQMCAGDWGNINYENLPSRAGFIYKGAFKKHDEQRYSDYLSKALKADGSVKMNAGTLYPYEIVKPMINSYRVPDNVDALEAYWKNLPNYCEGDTSNTLIVADTSGSMTCYDGGLPMAVATSLALYYAERNRGIFQNEFVTFSRNPRFYHFNSGDSLYNRVKEMVNLNICENTDIQAVFNLLLKAAKDNNLPAEEMPTRIIIVSDMEFDEAQGYYHRAAKTNFEEIKRKYSESGYEMPTLVFWNVASHQDNVPVKMDEKGVVLVSGCSPSTFQMAMTNNLDPYKFMMSVIDKERYLGAARTILN